MQLGFISLAKSVDTQSKNAQCLEENLYEYAAVDIMTIALQYIVAAHLTSAPLCRPCQMMAHIITRGNTISGLGAVADGNMAKR